ncbi:MAG TPA: HTH domain-containing protein [Crenotrichaceae bacterium]|nr:HTH domain-containing protein [Crenotrichaceae bacterium]
MQKSVSSRQQQLLAAMMNSRSALSIDELADLLEISRTAIQQHITILQRDGHIEHGKFIKTAGRPIQTFILTESGIHLFTKRYSWFSGLLLDDLKQQLGSEGLSQYLRKLGVRQGKQLLEQLNGMQPAEKITAIGNLMQEMGFEASVQLGGGSELPVVNACNCVYHDLAQQHQEMCQFDHALLATLSGCDVDIIECIADGGCACRFKFNSICN